MHCAILSSSLFVARNPSDGFHSPNGPLHAVIGLSCSCQIEAHNESVARPLRVNPDGPSLLLERRDELIEPASVL